MSDVLNRFSVDVSEVTSSKIKYDTCRLDPSFYSSNQNFMNSIDTKPLLDFCEQVFNPLVFKREFVEDSSECRYLASAEITSHLPELTYITNDQADRLNIRVKENWILVTGFGTIGSIRIADKIINGYAVANNVARIIAKPGFIGYLACFLESKFGNKLLNDYAAGAVVKYIEAPQISGIPVPTLPDNIISEIDKLYLKAVTCREQSHELLTKANNLVLKYNNLPQLNTSEISTLDPDKKVHIRDTNFSEFTSDYRLDAHFYNPVAKKAIDNIVSLSNNYSSLIDLTNDIIIGKRFKRNYVESNFGTPFLSGKNIIQIRPSDLKYLSDSEISFISDLLIKKDWTLVTCSGTIGRTCFVYENYEDYAASQHILRVVPNKEIIDPGYLYCFLSTDYGYYQILRGKYGSVIDEIDDKNIENVLIPIVDNKKQKEIGDLVRKAYTLRGEAIQLENQAQEILTNALAQ